MYSREEAFKKCLEYFKGDELASNVFLDKYALKDKQGNLLEKSPVEMHNRMAVEFYRIERKYPNPMKWIEVIELLNNFKYIIPGGSQMAGVGNDTAITSLSNCFVIDSAIDSYGGIMNTDQEQIQIMKRRGGVGHDLSNLRPSGVSANNSILGQMAGTTLYMDRFSNSTREVAQDGRRGALMLSIDVRHPDCDKFIDAKMQEGKVIGANISVRISDDFMRAIEQDEDFIQTFPIHLHREFDSGIIGEEYNILYKGATGYFKKIKARELWNKIIKNAHQSAEPGILFWDTIIRESPADCYGEQYKTVSTNPCVTGDTLILTKEGEKRIDTLIYKDVEVWNGDEWSLVTPKITGEDQKIIKLKFQEAKDEKRIKEIKCTLYHKFHLFGFKNGEKIIQAKDLEIGDRLCGWGDESGNITWPLDLISIELQDEYEDLVYCFNEPKNHTGIFNGILTGQCGEIPLCPYDSCRLTAINLYSYVNDPFTDKATFNYELFQDHTNKAQRLMDDLIDLEIEKIDKILDKIESDPEPEDIKLTEFKLWLKIRQKAIEGRRTGLGITAEADMLAALGLRYGTPEATEFSVNVHRIFAIESYRSSIQLAKERGAFPIYDFTKEVNNSFIKRIYKELSQEDQNNLFFYGRRNIANLTIAPTGTVSLMTQTTSGIEPLFKPFYKRKRKVNKSTDKTTTDQHGDIWEEYFVIHDKFKEWFKINYPFIPKDFLDNCSEIELSKYFEHSPYYKATANDIDWKESVRMQGEVQKWIDHSISKTVNLPSETTIEQVDELYRLAHKSGCKGLTIYRDGSREGVLTSSSKEKKKEFEYLSSIKIPKERVCDIYHKTAMKKSWMIVVGKVEDKPVEIFAFEDLENHIFPMNITKGSIIKEKSKVYSLTSTDSDKTYKIKNVVDLMTDVEGVDTRKYSLMLRHRINPQFIIDQIREYATITSFDKVIERILLKYVKEEKTSKEVCPTCKSKLIRQEGCLKCTCGWSKCG